jgi:phosphoglycolate phosphatase-like HAD superfamily hydrolase
MIRTVAVWDIDGTLADHGHRAGLLEKRCTVCLHQPMPTGHHEACPTCGNTSSTVTQASWDNFLNPDLMAEDTPIPKALEVMDQLRKYGTEVHYITGRSRDNSWAVTEYWLQYHVDKRTDEMLFMREAEDKGAPASVYKERAVARLKEKIGSEGLFLFFEDDPHVFPVYNKHGIVVRCPQGLEHFMPNGVNSVEEAWHI